MNTPWAVGEYLVVPYQPFQGNLEKNEVILAACEAHPERFTVPMTRGDMRASVAWMLTNPLSLTWEVWRGGELVGILHLDRIVPNVDARWHFVFFDGELVGKQALLQEFMRRAFELPLERLSIEIPENVASLISFVRRKLGFSYEGGNLKGSRREHSHFDGKRWYDIILLRLRRTEFRCP